MKKGCFLTFLTFLTISLGIVFYLIKNDKLSFEKIAKPIILKGAKEKFAKDISHIKSSPEKDTLISIVNGYLTTLQFAGNDSLDHFGDKRFFDEIEYAIHDAKIDSTEISRIKDLFNKHLTLLHARQKKNTD